MFGIGLPELTIILVIALVVFGARKLPNIGTGIGKSIRNFKKEVSGTENNSPKKLSQWITQWFRFTLTGFTENWGLLDS